MRATDCRFTLSLVLLVTSAALRGDLAGQETPPPVAPSTPDSKLTPEKVQERIQQLEGSPEIDEELRKKVLEILGQARTRLEDANRFREQTTRLRADVDAAPKEAATIRDDLANRAGTAGTEPKIDIPVDAKSEDLKLQLAKESSDLNAQKSQLEALTTQIQTLQGRPAKAGEEEVLARQKLEEIARDKKVAPPPDEAPELTAARQILLEARRQARLEEIAMLKQETLSQPMRLELANARRELASQEVARLEARVKKLDEAYNARLAAEAEALQQKQEEEKRAAIDKHPLVRAQIERNARIANDIADITADTKSLAPDQTFVEDQNSPLKSNYQRIEGQLTEFGKAGVEARLLLEQRRTLPALQREAANVIARWRGKAAVAESKRFNISTELRALGDLDREVDGILSEAAKRDNLIPAEQREEITGEVRRRLANRYRLLERPVRMYSNYLTTLRKLQATRRELREEVRKTLVDRRPLLEQAKATYDNYATMLRKLNQDAKEIQETASKFTVLLDEYLLWIPSANPPDASVLRDLAAEFWWILHPSPWIDAIGVFVNDYTQNPILPSLAFLVILGLLLAAPRIRDRIEAAAEDVRKIDVDRFGITLKSMVLTLLLAVPVPFAMGVVAWRLLEAEQATAFARGLGAGLWSVAELVFFLLFFLMFCRKKGIAEIHLRWRPRTVKILRRHLLWLLPLLALSTFATTTIEVAADKSLNVTDNLGRLAFMASMVLQAIFIQRVIRPRGGVSEPVIQRYPDGWLARLRWIWYPVAVGVPLVLATVAATGYFYTALQLERRMIITVWLVVGVIILNSLAIRWLLIAQRRLAVEQAREKREAEARAGEEKEDPAESASAPSASPSSVAPAPTTPPTPAVAEQPEVDILTINEQTRQLIRTLMATAVVVGLWIIWSSVLPALAILNEYQLWDVGTAEAPNWITLRHVALAVIAGFLTSAAARNLPGVLEIAVLKNLPLDAGSRYAITAVCQYVLVAIGITVAFNSIGVGWSQVQWLIAALSVGLGFGLQEIVANFVCGVILLFERPIRVGDIVTVGDVSGTVVRIRIRATTILNWDRKELVVPNKEFVTGRLLNWTLTDTINRLTFEVGVAYGTDLRRVRELLLEVADENPLVLKDPAPIVLFDLFGASSLDFKLMCFLPNFENRLLVMNEIRTAIAEKFREAGIEIAFPQLDLHLKDMPRDLTERSRGALPAPPQ